MKKLTCNFLIILMVAGLISCTTNRTASNESVKNASGAGFVEMNFAEAMSVSSLELFKRLSSKHKDQNITFSPVSLHLAFGMVYTGSRNNTALQISRALGYKSNMNEFNREYSEYTNYLNSFPKDTTLEFNLANRIYVDKTFDIKSSYRSVINKYFEGSFESADFQNNARAEEEKINSWVSEMTRERINGIIPYNTFGPSTSMVIVNAIYIKALWEYQFDANETRQKEFFTNAENSTPTKFMTKRQKTGLKYTRYNDKQVLELPYTEENMSLMIILPDNSNSKNITSKIPNAVQYTEIIRRLKAEDIYMEIPKFKIESSFELSQDLMAMGITDAFRIADLSGISDSKQLQVSNILQKVFFEVDEKGTEAAAATAITIRTTSIIIEPDQDFVSFIADRPFIFILKENKTNTPLFIGQYIKP